MLPLHVHPVPAVAVTVNPLGVVSVTDTSPLVAGAPAAFDTVTIYVAICPCTKLPLCAEATLSPAACTDTVQLPMGSHPLLALDPAAYM